MLNGLWLGFFVVAALAAFARWLLGGDATVFAAPAATRLANPNTSATQLTAYGLGLNWHLSRSVRANFNLFQNKFELAPGAAPAANALITDDETTFISRVQVAF